MTLEFQAWPKIPRLANETVQITEKIDGTNACVVILPWDEDYEEIIKDGGGLHITDYTMDEAEEFLFMTQSRKRFIKPGKDTDNAGFARWAWDLAPELLHTLGMGKHYGEWYGQGIQHGYGLTEKRFALFNASRWQGLSKKEHGIENLEVVPVLYDGPVTNFDSDKHLEPVKLSIDMLRDAGSMAVPGYMKPEGVIAYYRLARVSYKAFLENNDTRKGAQ